MAARDEIREGFDRVVAELRLLREDSRDMMPRRTHELIVRTLCFMMVSLVVWFTGVQPRLGELVAAVAPSTAIAEAAK